MTARRCRVQSVGGWRDAVVLEESEARVRVRFADNGKTLWVARSRTRNASGSPLRVRVDGLPDTVPVPPPTIAQTPHFIDAPPLPREFRPQPKPEKPGREPAYLAFVRGNSCCACLKSPPSDAHHFGPRGTSQKADDATAVPLCRGPAGCHAHFHQHGTLANLDRAQTEAVFAGAQRRLRDVWRRWKEIRT